MKIYIFVENESANYFIDEIKFLKRNKIDYCIVCFSSSRIDSLREYNQKVINYKGYNSIKNIFQNFVLIIKILKIELTVRNFSKELFLNLRNTISIISRSIFLANEVQKIKEIKKSICISYRFNQCATVLSILRMEKQISKCYTRAHGVDLYEKRYNKKISLRGFQMKYIDGIFCVSKNGANYIKELFPKYLDKITYSYLGTNIYCEKINIVSNKNIIRLITISFLNPIKQIDKLFDDLNKINIKIEWVHIGDGPQLDLLRNKKIYNDNLNISFIGRLNPNEISTYLNVNYFDFSVCYSYDEGLPIYLTEVTKFGIPIISYDVGGISEIVLPNSGVLMEKNQNIINVLKSININKFRSKEFRIKIKDDSEKHFKLDKNLDNFYKRLNIIN